MPADEGARALIAELQARVARLEILVRQLQGVAAPLEEPPEEVSDGR